MGVRASDHILAEAHYPPDRSQPVFERSIGDALRGAAAKWPCLTALIEGIAARDKPGRFRRFWQILNVSRGAILSHFSPGDHVAVCAANSPEWVLIELGAALAGVTLVTVNPAYLASELAFVLKQSKACGIFVQNSYRDRDLAAVVEQVRSDLPQLRTVVPLSTLDDFAAAAPAERALPAVTGDDVAQIQYTSGTTGIPKGARLTHRSLGNNGRFFAQTVGAMRMTSG
jgi:fatty-acyl-CoA synthase